MSSGDERLDPDQFFYGPGSDAGGMRCVGKMSMGELQQALCRSLKFRTEHDAWHVGYRGKKEMERAIVEAFSVTKQ
jgi:hypothetical protein